MASENVVPLNPRFAIETVASEGASVVVLTGEIDLEAAPVATGAIRDAVAARRPVLVDLCACTFIDSSGLSALLVGLRAAKQTSTAFGVASAPGSPPRALFDLALGHSFFVSSDDRASGLAALHAQAT